MGPEDRQFPEFFVSEYGRLRRLGFLLTGSWTDGEELAQETLVRIYWRWSLVRRQEHPEAYARKVLVNRHRSLLRRLRLEARHAGRERVEAIDPGPREELMVSARPSAGFRPANRPCWCCATTRTCPSRRWRGCCGSRWARSGR